MANYITYPFITPKHQLSDQPDLKYAVILAEHIATSRDYSHWLEAVIRNLKENPDQQDPKYIDRHFYLLTLEARRRYPSEKPILNPSIRIEVACNLLKIFGPVIQTKGYEKTFVSLRNPFKTVSTISCLRGGIVPIVV